MMKRKTNKLQIFSIYWQLYEKNKRKPIPYYELVIDPRDMMNTFDNAFQLSFLFRDGYIGFEYDEHKMPAIRSIDDDKQKKQSGENKQFIAKLDAKIISVSIDEEFFFSSHLPLMKIKYFVLAGFAGNDANI